MSFDLDQVRHAQRQRLRFIESVAFWEGAVDRPRVCGAFKVSENHVTKDFRLYKEAYPGNLQYDESARVYRPTRRFRPRISKGSVDEYLALLKSSAEQGDADPQREALIATVVVDVVPQPHGKLSAATLNAITRAISAGTGLEIEYQSFSGTANASSTRKVWPHALAFGGTRWNARAFDERRSDFIDLVLHRILSVKALDERSPRAPAEDEGWTQLVDVEVVPARRLSRAHADVVASEYGMEAVGKDWVWRASMRKCLVGYFVRLHRLDLEQDEHRLIELRSRAAISPYMFPTDDVDTAPRTKVSKGSG